MVSTRKRAAAQEPDSDDEAPAEVTAQSARDAHHQAAAAQVAAAEESAARKRARAQRPLPKRTEEDDLDVLPDEVLAAVVGHSGFEQPAAAAPGTPAIQPLRITRRGLPMERAAGPVKVKVLSAAEEDALHAAAAKAASDFLAARMQRAARCNSMLRQPAQVRAARRVGKPY